LNNLHISNNLYTFALTKLKKVLSVMKGYKQKNMACQTFSHFDENGNKVYKDKVKYDTEEEALKAAYAVNSSDKAITKVAAYKCWKCGKWHLGRTCHKLTDEDKEKYSKKLSELK